MDQDNNQKSKLPTRPLRISRAAAKVPSSVRPKPEEKSNPPPENPPASPKKDSTKDEIETIQPTVSRNRGRGRSRGRRANVRRNRLDRVRKVSRRNNPLRFRERRRRNNNRFGGFRRNFGVREIFIAGLPRNVNSGRLFSLLRNQGRLVRCNVVYDRYRRSKGIAFAEFESHRDAWRVVNRWRGRRIGNFTIFVALRRPRRMRRNNNFDRFRKFRGRGGRFGQNQRGFGNRFGPIRYRGRGRRGGYRGN